MSDVLISQLSALFSVIIIDIVLAGDNAIVVGMAAAGLPPRQRRRVIAIGIAAATVLRIVFAALTAHLLAIIGLTLAGGVLLLWVAWKMYRELMDAREQRRAAAEAIAESELEEGANERDEPASVGPVKTFRQAVIQIVVADVSMSLDNVLAVAGTARDHLWVLVVGLALSVALMGIASTLVARLLERHHWISWIGLAIIAFVALRMIYEGGGEVLRHVAGL